MVGATSTSLVNQTIQSPTAKIGLLFSLATGSVQTTYTTYGAFATAIAGMKATAIVQSPHGHRTLFQDMPIPDLIEISSANEGCVDADTSNLVTTTIELSERGAIQLDENHKLILNISGLPSAMNCSVYALDHPSLVSEAINYEQKAVLANAETTFDAMNYNTVALPTSLTYLEIAYLNGRTIRFTSSELALITKDVNELVANWNGSIVSGSSAFHTIDITHAVSIKVQFGSAVNFYMVRELPIIVNG